jgi:hypothetical protein
MLHEKLMKALKDKKKDLSDDEKDAKMDVVKDLRQSAMDSMKGRLDGLKKVSVMSDSSKGLEEGLNKAQDIISNAAEHKDKDDDAMEESESHLPGQDGEPEHNDEGPAHESMESDEEESEEHPEEMNHEDLMKHIEELQALAAKMKK